MSLGSLRQAILKRSKRCMQRMERDKPRSDPAWRFAGRANQLLYVHRRECSVGRANVQVIPDSIPALPEVGRQDLDVNVIHGILPDTQIYPVPLIARGILEAQAQASRAICLYKEPGLQAQSRRWLRGVATDLEGTSGQTLPRVLTLQLNS